MRSLTDDEQQAADALAKKRGITRAFAGDVLRHALSTIEAAKAALAEENTKDTKSTKT